MARVTASEVKELVDTELSDSVVDSWIDVANELTTDIQNAGNVSSSRLDNIEKLLAGHFLRTQDKDVASESVKDARFDFTGSFGKYLEQTRYGQQAKVLDPTGTLAQSEGQGKATLDAYGVDVC